jgi:hypothetical protein
LIVVLRLLRSFVLQDCCVLLCCETDAFVCVATAVLRLRSFAVLRLLSFGFAAAVVNAPTPGSVRLLLAAVQGNGAACLNINNNALSFFATGVTVAVALRCSWLYGCPPRSGEKLSDR